jgi:carbamoyltransferase
MRILGAKFWGQESAVFVIDTVKREIFAINSDRVSRIKKDNFDISPALDKFPAELSSLDVAAYSFGTFDGRDAVLETKGTSYYWLNWQHRKRKLTRPRYFADLVKRPTILESVGYALSALMTPSIFYFWLVREYYWSKYRNGTLPDSFHFGLVDRYIKELLQRYGSKLSTIEYHDHHLCHASSSYYLSPFAYSSDPDAVVFTLDEHGDGAFSSIHLFDSLGHKELARSVCEKFWIGDRVHVTSIAALYSNFTEAMGLRRACDEGKVEAFAAYGKPDMRLYAELRRAIYIDDLKFKVNLQDYVELCDIDRLREVRRVISDEAFCATIQYWLEEIVVEYLNGVYEKVKINNLCLAGGVTANVIMNYKIQTRTPFKKFFVVPAMGDEGSAAGAAILSALAHNQDLSWLKDQQMPYWGPRFDRQSVEQVLREFGSVIRYEDIGTGWWKRAADAICSGKIIAVFQGRMEFGPRALGNRSILASVTDKTMRDKMNLSIKRRPQYQPFCPAVLEEDREILFSDSYRHKHMATAFLMKQEFRDKLPSAVHVDGTARPQFVEENDNPAIYGLLKEVKRRIGFGVVINTSFNLHGRTIVNSPEDALTDFLDCNLDELYIEGFRVTKSTN